MLVHNKLSAYSGSSVLITGGLGFIGSNLARQLVEMGDVNISIVDSLRPDQGGNFFNIRPFEQKVKVKIADISDESVAGELVGGADFIFNLAGSVSHVNSMLQPQSDLALNCSAQLNFLEACRKSNPHVKIVFSSTRQVYGRPIYLPVDEEHRLSPPDINAVHKITAENYHLLYHRLYGMRTVCLRLTNTYGPRQLMNHDRQSFIAWFTRQAIDGQPIELFGGGRQRRDLNYVDDVVEALLLAGVSESAEGEIFNLGGEPVTLAEIVDELIAITDCGSAVHQMPFPPERLLIDIGNFYSTYTKMESVIGWKPSTSLSVGLAQTIDYYKKYRTHYWNVNADSLPRSQTTI